MRVALAQLNSGDDPVKNRDATLAAIRDGVAQGAEFVLTPEVTNCVSASRSRQGEVLRHEEKDETLPALTAAAREHGIHTPVNDTLLGLIENIERGDMEPSPALLAKLRL